MSIGAGFLLLAALAAGLPGCANRQPLPPAGETDRRFEGRGFTVSPPRGGGWHVARQTPDAAVFLKAPEETAEGEPGAAIVTAALGVRSLPARQLSALSEAGFAAGAGRFLMDQFGDPAFHAGSPLLAPLRLDVHPYRWNGAVCARYESFQVARPGLQVRDPELGFSNHGFLCRHPRSPETLVQAFFNERYYRVLPRQAAPATRREAERVMKSLAFPEIGPASGGDFERR